MYGNGKIEGGNASATVFISEPKILDLSTLLGRKNGNGYVPPSPKTNSSKSTFTPRPLTSSAPTTNTPYPKNSPNPMFNNQLNELIRRSSISNGNKIVQQNNRQDSKSKWNSRLCFSGDYIFYKDNKLTNREYGDTGIQFKCTYPGCYKRLSTNINFVNHIVAHTRQLHFKVPNNGAFYEILYGIGANPRPINEKPQIHCTECLSEFNSPKKLYKHQFYVHQYAGHSTSHQPVCHICEKNIDLANADKHADIHGESEMPFDCPICGWRSSSRQALLFHVERQHSASTILICPFCLDTYNPKKPSTVKSQRIILTSTQFVDHVLEHFQDNTKKSNCSRCSLKFCADSYAELTEKLKFHGEMHKSASKLRFERKSLKKLFASNPNQRTADIKALSPMCTDCGYLIKSVDSHYRKKQSCENTDCQFETRCKLAFKQHSVLCPLKEGSTSNSRLSLNQASCTIMNSLNTERIRLKCSLCSFVSKDTALFNDHLSKECIGAKPIFGSKKFVLPRKRKLMKEECEEIDLFSLESTSKRLKSEENDFLNGNPNKKANWLSKVVPFISDRNLAVFKKNSIVNTVSIVDETSSVSATNEFFTKTQFFDDYSEEEQLNSMKIAQKLFPPSRFPQRKM